MTPRPVTVARPGGDYQWMYVPRRDLPKYLAAGWRLAPSWTASHAELVEIRRKVPPDA